MRPAGTRVIVDFCRTAVPIHVVVSDDRTVGDGTLHPSVRCREVDDAIVKLLRELVKVLHELKSISAATLRAVAIVPSCPDHGAPPRNGNPMTKHVV